MAYYKQKVRPEKAHVRISSLDKFDEKVSIQEH